MDLWLFYFYLKAITMLLILQLFLGKPLSSITKTYYLSRYIQILPKQDGNKVRPCLSAYHRTVHPMNYTCHAVSC